MPYDPILAERIGAALSDRRDITQSKMFGGVAFLLNGHLAVGASSQGGLIVRADPDDGPTLIAQGAQTMVMQGRAMSGWLHVEGEDVDDDNALQRWIAVGVAYAQSLPPKPPKPAKASKPR